jgi:hypothetical protein
MARVKLNPVTEQIRGAIGDLVFRLYLNRIVVGRKRAPSDQPPTPAMLAVQARFKRAAAYARTALADPAKKAFYAAWAKTHNTLTTAAAMGDFLNPPEVKEINLLGYHGAIGNKIGIVAEDDHGVVSVQVTIKDAVGAVIEQGLAVPAADGWEYTAQAAAPIDQTIAVEAEATDHAAQQRALSEPWHA